MGKKSKKKDVVKEEREPLVAVAAADEDIDASASANVGGGGPPPPSATITPYRDDPQASDGGDGGGGGGSAPRTNPTTGGGGGRGPALSIFDWDDEGVGGGTDGAEKMEVAGAAADDDDDDDAYRIDDELFGADSNGFSPVSLHDDDSDDDDNNNEDEDGDEERGGLINGASSETKDAERIRIKANSLLNQSLSVDDDEEEDDRIFVGGGWGRHGSSRGVCSFRCCCFKRTEDDLRPKKDPALKRRGSLGWAICAGIAFLALVIGSGYVGYEAGLPADDDDDVSGGADAGPEDGGNAVVVVHHHHTKGDEWLEWLEKEIVQEKDNFHGARWQFHHPKPNDKGEGGGGNVGGVVEGGVDAKPTGDGQQQQPHYEPRTQVELLHISENVFQSCSERSLATIVGRDACLSLCRGRYCCFEREEAYGSCVQEQYSYCFAYAACENAIVDFDMNNANTGAVATVGGAGEKKDDVVLNALDTKLLSETCSMDNLATLDGMRDCTAFCEHHMCCFTKLENWGCRGDRMGECEAYEMCRALEETWENGGAGYGNAAAGSDGDNSGPISNVVVDKDIETAVHALCSLGDKLPDGDDSWVKPCHALCADYLCCFSPDESNCRGVYGEDMCNAYQGCAVLHASSADATSGAEISGGKGNANAVAEEKPAGQGHESQYGTLDKASYDLLTKTCSPGNIASLDGIRDCTGYCEHHMCCFSELDEWSCRGESEGECEAYDTCKVLLGAQIEDEEFVVNCMQSNLNENWDLCGQHCAKYECCFGMEDSCYFENKLMCDYFYLCENFFVDDGQGGTKKVDRQRQQGGGKGPGDMDIEAAIHAVCHLGDMLPDGDDSWVSACHDLCAGHLCCFSSGESNCRDDYYDDQCDLYQGCSVLHGSVADKTSSDSGNRQEVDAVNEACVSKAKRDPWLAEKCRNACDSRACCFSSDHLYNCMKGREEWCGEFQACDEVLYN